MHGSVRCLTILRTGVGSASRQADYTRKTTHLKFCCRNARARLLIGLGRHRCSRLAPSKTQNASETHVQKAVDTPSDYLFQGSTRSGYLENVDSKRASIQGSTTNVGRIRISVRVC